VNRDDCHGVRMSLTAALDGEREIAPADRQHLSTCSSCGRWFADMQSMAAQLHDLAYPAMRGDLWPNVEDGIGSSNQHAAEMRRLIAVGCVLFAWRGLQLLVDLPIPALHPLVPFVVTVLALSFVARDSLAIETSAPELQK